MVNDQFCKGPSFIPQLVTVLLRLRKEKFLLMGDFLQIGLNDNQRYITGFPLAKIVNQLPSDDNLITYLLCLLEFRLDSIPFSYIITITDSFKLCFQTVSN